MRWISVKKRVLVKGRGWWGVGKENKRNRMKRCEMKCNNVNTNHKLQGTAKAKNKQTNKQANKQVMGHGGALGMRDGGWRMGGAKHREEARSAKQQPYRQRRSSTNETCEWRPTSTQAEAAAIEPASGAQNWRKWRPTAAGGSETDAEARARRKHTIFTRSLLLLLRWRSLQMATKKK